MNVLIFSVNQNHNEYDDMHSQLEIEATMDEIGVPYKVVYGMYSGVSELSYILEWTPDREQFVRNTCESFNQQCYLITGENRWHGLLRPNGAVMADLGQYKIVNERPTKDHTDLGDGRFLLTA
jgi:hypothetical protein